jgi:ubiquinone/menaquinone biosynthesis C-methylase UbiE
MKLLEKIEMRLLEKSWDELAQVDPMWAILAQKGKENRRWNSEEFFLTGEKTLKSIIEKIYHQGISIKFGRALDFGCGIGRISFVLSKYFNEVYALDISKEMLKIAENIKVEWKVNNVNFFHFGGDVLHFDSGYFDFVICILVLQHIPQVLTIKKLLKELLRVNGGIAVIQIPNYIRIINSLKLSFKRYLYYLFRILGTNPATLLKMKLYPVVMNYISEDEVKKIIVESNSKVILCERSIENGVDNRTYFIIREKNL